MNKNDETDRALEFERKSVGEPTDETDLSLRAYVARIDPLQLAKYRKEWSDEQVTEWDGNFKSDGGLMLVCCERDVEVPEFRKVLEEWIEFSRG